MPYLGGRTDPIRIRYAIGNRIVRFRIVTQAPKILLEPWGSSNGWVFKSVARPEVREYIKVFFVRGYYPSTNEDEMIIPRRDWGSLSEAVMEFNQTSGKFVSLEEQFFLEHPVKNCAIEKSSKKRTKKRA